MQAVFHMMHIGTLATWLSVAGLGTVAVMIPNWHQTRPLLALAEEIQLLDMDFTLGHGGQTESSGMAAAENPAAADESQPEIPQEQWIQPPALPPMEDYPPMPEVPELPPVASAMPAPSREPTPFRRAHSAASAGGRASAVGNTPARRSGVAGMGNARATGSGGGLSESARLAAGSMPPPAYPAEARRRGQTGTVVVEFTVDSSGRVIAAHAKAPSPWPLLDREAVRTVRRWKFPPGSVMKLQRPIVFKLR